MKGPPIGVSRRVKFKTHVKMILFTILFSYGFWISVYYLSVN